MFKADQQPFADLPFLLRGPCLTTGMSDDASQRMEIVAPVVLLAEQAQFFRAGGFFSETDCAAIASFGFKETFIFSGSNFRSGTRVINPNTISDIRDEFLSLVTDRSADR